MPEEYLSGPGAEMFCAEWRAFVHAVVTAALMQHTPNTVFLAYLRQTGNLLTAAKGDFDPADETSINAALNAFVDGPFAQYMPLLAAGAAGSLSDLFAQRLAIPGRQPARPGHPPDDHAKGPSGGHYGHGHQRGMGQAGAVRRSGRISRNTQQPPICFCVAEGEVAYAA